MNKNVTPTSPSATSEPAPLAWPALPTETEVYILPDGRVIIADMPAEFAPILAELGLAPPAAPPTQSSSLDVQ